MTADGPRARRGGIVLGGVAALVVVVLLAIVLLVRGGGDADPIADGGLTATPVASATGAGAEGTATGAPVPTPSSAPTSTAGPTPDEPTAGQDAATEGDDGSTEEGADGAAPGDADAAEPGDADVAAAEAAFAPDGAQEVQTLRGDLDGDPDDEVVIASRLGDRSRVDVLDWVDGAYDVVFTGEGGSATGLVGLDASDVDGAPATQEVVLRQVSGTEGESASLWGLRSGAWVPLAASGGCWDGSHTYGIVGAVVEPQRITATCDGSPDPIVSWPSDVYVWDEGVQAFALDTTIQP